MSEPQAQRVETWQDAYRKLYGVAPADSDWNRVEPFKRAYEYLTTQHQAALAQARAEEREWVLTRLIDEAAYLGVADGKVDKIIYEIRKRAAVRPPSNTPGERGGQG